MQKLTGLIPDFLKPMLRPIYRGIEGSPLLRKLRTTLIRRKPREDLQAYWKQPWDGVNLPQDYLVGDERSKFLVDLVKKHADSQSSILEIGCNVGRNLNHLFLAGFEQLLGIEISEEAVRLSKEAYPEMTRCAKIINEPAEESLRKLEDNSFDITFTMAVLQHIHPESEFIFSEMVRITKGFLITIEDELGMHWRSFPRNYGKIFQSLGLKQLYESNCHKVAELGSTYIVRVFKKL